MKVPFNNLYAQYLTIKSDIDLAIAKVIEQSAYIKSQYVRDFENQYATLHGLKHCITCANGTDSLEIALKAFGIGAGDEVIVPAFTWISTSEAVSSLGAKVVFVDVHPEKYTIDASKIEQKITKNTRAIIPVHFYGLPAEMDEILALANKYNLKVLEDCAQAHLATYKGKKMGTIGDMGSFSFFPGKNLGAYGDAGGLITNNEEYAEFSRKYADHGRSGKHDHAFEGRNSRLDGLQAAILLAKLPHLEEWTKKRQNIARHYCEELTGLGYQLPICPDYSTHAYHLFVIQTERRDELKDYLAKNEIESGIHYPKALPFTSAYSSHKATANDYPVAYRMMDRILSLPIFPEMEQNQIEHVIRTLKTFSKN
jgi:dTDP-4-amino-4,6-dideoxygalactose transaminase